MHTKLAFPQPLILPDSCGDSTTCADSATSEYHYVPFNSDVTEWQFSSLTIIPQKATTEVASIKINLLL